MTYSCAVWGEDSGTLEQAQIAKVDLSPASWGCARVPGSWTWECGWGTFVIPREGVRAHAVGVTLSQAQADFAAQAGRR